MSLWVGAQARHRLICTAGPQTPALQLRPCLRPYTCPIQGTAHNSASLATVPPIPCPPTLPLYLASGVLSLPCEVVKEGPEVARLHLLTAPSHHVLAAAALTCGLIASGSTRVLQKEPVSCPGYPPTPPRAPCRALTGNPRHHPHHSHTDGSQAGHGSGPSGQAGGEDIAGGQKKTLPPHTTHHGIQ